jgi:methylmalonyl-CoA/ethylmalonyl-CoA epimerase
LDASAFTFRHLGVAVASIDKAIPVYRDLFGYELTSGPFDDPIQKVSVCFLGRASTGDITIELVAPLGEDSPVNRTLAKGGSAYHVCYEVDDLDGTLAQLSGKGCLVVSKPVPAVAFNQRRIAWLYTPTRQLVEMLEK